MILTVVNTIYAIMHEEAEKNLGHQRGLKPWPRDTGVML